MNKVFLSLGSNIGSRKNNLAKAIRMLQRLDNTIINSESSIYETTPLYNHNQDYFFNKVIQIRTEFTPHELLKEIKSIELSMGRDIINSHNNRRIIDIDILVFENIKICSDSLVLPHPRILDRQFVLEPWKEIAPEYIITGENLSIKELYNKYLGNRFKNQKVEIINN